MQLNTPRTTFLLGAGASVEAGMPISSSLTEAMAGAVDASRDEELRRAIHAAIGAMVAHDTTRGRSAFDGVDIERLFSAVEMLSDRGSQELAPFVSAWSPAASFTGGQARLPPGWVDQFFGSFSDVLAGKRAGMERRFEEVFAKGVQAAQDNEHGDEVFGRLRKFMLTRLPELLRVDMTKVDYLAPLLNAVPPIRIATLNYDTTIEDLAWRAGVACTTGIETWEPGQEWAWDAASAIRLLKLHGSLTWGNQQKHSSDTHQDLPETEIVQFGRRADGSWRIPNAWYEGSPGVVFGQRGKVRAEGPFIPMLRAFDEFLSESDTLVIVGYSMRDDHINLAITRWYNRGDRHLVLVDPHLPEAQGLFFTRQNREGFRDVLVRRIHEWVEVGEGGSERGSVRPRDPHVVLRRSTGEALIELLGLGPALPDLPLETNDGEDRVPVSG